MADRLPRYALYAFVVGLPLHNVAMAELWKLGVRGVALDVVSAWKEVLLAAALGAVLWAGRGRLPFRPAPVDGLALAYTAFVLAYALIPQHVLDGNASAHGILYAVRHDLTPVAAYALGRSIHLDRVELRRVGLLILGIATAVAVWGLIDVYAIPLDAWRHSGAPGWFREQLGLEYKGLSGLPENFVYNPGDERPLRRLVSTFLSPLATGYLLVVALLVATAWERARWLSTVTAILLGGLLFTYSRTSIVALALGLAVLAYGLRSRLPLAAAIVLVGMGVFFVKAYPDIGPRTSFTAAELRVQRENAREHPGASGDATSVGEASVDSHLASLRAGTRTVVHHPQGFGLGNAGVTAKRTREEIKAGESTYTELGVELGLLGMLAFIGWNLLLFRRVLPRAPWLGASLAAVLVLGIQTDVIGVHWLAFCLWTLAGERA